MLLAGRRRRKRDLRHPVDRRTQLVKLTAEGRRTFRAMANAHENWIAEILGDLTRNEQETLMRLLGKAKASARKAIGPGDTK